MGTPRRTLARPLVKWQPLRRLGIGVASLALVTTTWAGLAVTTPAAESLEEIRMTYGSLEVPPISLAELESFALTGIASRDLQALLTLLRIDESRAQHILTREIPIDFDSLREVSDSFVGQFFWRLLATTITVDSNAGAAWQVLQDAVLQAANRDRLTLLDILRSVDASVLVIDSQRVIAVASQIGENFENIEWLLSILLGK